MKRKQQKKHKLLLLKDHSLHHSLQTFLPQIQTKTSSRFTTCKSTVSYGDRRTRESVPRLNHVQGGNVESCDVFSGKWVFHNASYPLYDESSFPYMSDQLACRKHGRSKFAVSELETRPCEAIMNGVVKKMGFVKN